MNLIKKSLAFALLTLSLAMQPALAAKKSEPSNQLETNRTQAVLVWPAGFLIGQFGVGYSFEISDHIALTPGISGYYVSAGILDTSSSIYGIGPFLAARFFLSDTAFNSGWYVEPSVTLGYGSFGNSLSGFGLSVAAVGGYAWYFDGGFTINIGAGGAYTYVTNRHQSDVGSYLFFPHPTLDFALGYSW